MISEVSRRAVSWHELTIEDARILAGLRVRSLYLAHPPRAHTLSYVSLVRGTDARDAETMYILTDSRDEGLTSAQEKASGILYRGGRL